MELYAWQKACLKQWNKNRYHGIVNVVTGAGKTVLALAAADQALRQFPDLRVKVVVPTIALAGQWKLALLHHAETEEFRPGFFGGGIKDDPARRVMIYVINSARDSLAGHMRTELAVGHHVLLICDECHHCQSPHNRKIFSFLTQNNQVTQGAQLTQEAQPAQGSPSHAAKIIPFSRRDPGEQSSEGQTFAIQPAMKQQTAKAPRAADGLYLSLGLSATPFGTGQDKILTDALGREIYSYGFSEAAAASVIAPYTVCEVGASFLPKELEAYAELSEEIRILMARLLKAHEYLAGLPKVHFMKEVTRIAKAADMDPSEPAAAFLLAAYQRKEITTLAHTRILCTLAILRQLAEEDRVLVFCERIEQAEALYSAAVREFGSRTGLYHSKLIPSARRRILEEFRTRKTRILISCKALDEGIDVPDANIGIVVSSTSVSRQRIQRMGRIIRKASDKKAATLYYLYIRESTEDSAYLDGMPEAQRIAVRYYPEEESFSHDLYEYAAGELLRRAAEKGFTKEQQAELRACLLEGLIRTDCLLGPDQLKALSKNAATTHERNYWNVCRELKLT